MMGINPFDAYRRGQRLTQKHGVAARAGHYRAYAISRGVLVVGCADCVRACVRVCALLYLPVSGCLHVRVTVSDFKFKFKIIYFTTDRHELTHAE